MSIKPGWLLSVLSFVTKGGIHQINVPPENLFTPKLGSLHKYQIDFKRVPLEPGFSAFMFYCCLLKMMLWDVVAVLHCLLIV